MVGGVAVRGLFEDSTYNELGTQRSLAGADAIIEALQGWKTAMPDVMGTVTSAAESGQRVMLEVTWEGTQTGEMVTDEGTIPPSGKRQKTPSASSLTTRTGS
jgi:SnoaL-like polyketide cyclase